MARNWDGRGKVVVITGAATGLGLESATALAGRGATVVIGARDAAKVKRACERIRACHPAARLHSLRLDLGDLESVRGFAEQVARLPEVTGAAAAGGQGGGGTAAAAKANGLGRAGNGGVGNGNGGNGGGAGVYCLMLNAGVMNMSKKAAFPLVAGADADARDQPDLQFLTNHVGHQLLARLLEPELRRAGELARRGGGAAGGGGGGAAGGGGGGNGGGGDCARAVFLSSCAHFTTYPASRGGPLRLRPFGGPDIYEPWSAYGQSKLCNVLCAREFARRFEADGAPVVSVACHPGVIVATDLFRHIPGGGWPPLRAAVALLFKPFFKTIPQGAATQTFLATAPISRPSAGGGGGGNGGGGGAAASAVAGVRNGGYYADVNISPTSAAAADDALGTRLWDVTESICGAWA